MAWRVAEVQAVPSGLVLGMVVETAGLGLSNPANESMTHVN